MSEHQKFFDGRPLSPPVSDSLRVGYRGQERWTKLEFRTNYYGVLERREIVRSEIEQIVNEAIDLKLNGVLVLQGDPSPENPKNSGLIPSQVVKHLKELVDGKIDLFLSLPSNPNFDKIQKKIDAKPTGFITQVIGSEEQVSKIVKHLKPQGFKIIPILLYPSEKNQKSADFLKLDWSNYQNRFLDFVR